MDGSRPGFLEVVAADVDGVPFRNMTNAVGNDIHGEAERGLGPEDVGTTREVFLDDVVLRGSAQEFGGDATVLGVGDIQRQQPSCRGIDGHRGIHLGHWNLVHQGGHVAQVGHGDADFADLSGGLRGARVVASLCGQVEGDGESGLPLGQVGSVELVGLGRGGVP